MNTKPDVERSASLSPTEMDVTGLSDQEAAHRLQRRARLPQWSSRSCASIVRANVLTIFNPDPGGLRRVDVCSSATGATLFVGMPRDALPQRIALRRDRAGAYYDGRDDETLLTEPSE